MPWIALVSAVRSGVVDATAILQDDLGATLFTWNATIKVGSESEFAQTAKSEHAKHQDAHKDEAAIVATIETELNK